LNGLDDLVQLQWLELKEKAFVTISCILYVYVMTYS